MATHLEVTAGTKGRVRRSPAERAQGDLEAANARYVRAEKNRNRLKDELDVAQRELEAADVYYRYAAKHPDLPKADVALEFEQGTDG